ncbi:MAG: NAD-dependent succinate-semialdehyde dehydrogenase [Pseudomonadota bacterium]
MLDKTHIKNLLNDPTLLASQAYVNGKWVDASDGKTFDVTNPARGDVLTTLPDLGADITREAIEAAEVAQKPWAAKPAKEKHRIMRAFFRLMIENQEDLAIILTAEMGKPLAEAKGEIAYAASFIEWFGEEAKRIYGETIPGHLPDARITVLKQPVGVCAAITPWNFPSAMITRKLAPAIAAGCTMVLKPAAETPLSATALAVIAERAGVPKGVFNVITSKQSRAVGAEMCENDIVKKLTFTGSTEVGRILMAQCAPTIKKLSLELGGNAPFIVFEDADLDKAADGAIVCKFRNNGQTCVCANRIYVQAGVYDAFAEKLAERVAKMQVGDGLNGSTTHGPLIDAGGLEKVIEHVEDATSKGAKVKLGGKQPELGHTFYEPTILTDVTSDMMLTQEETFGPVAPLFKFNTEEEVVSLANDTIFGLASYFYSNDLNRVHRVRESLEYGIVGVNTGIISTEVAPFGGVKQSGLGREGSSHGIEEFLEMKYVCTSILN